MNTPIYNHIGIGYDTTRRADPYIAERILSKLQPTEKGIYLDVGCGTGNYLHYFSQNGFSFLGIDPSDAMLDIAKAKCPGCKFIKGYAENIPLDNNTLDGATGTFTLHHWEDKQQGFNELGRVLKPGSRIVFLSFTADQTEGYWLANYFPIMMKHSGDIPDMNTMFDMLHHAGFGAVETEKYFVHEGLQDHFLYSNKFKPEQYLNPEIRKGISSFAALSTKDELDRGLKQLETDIATGRIHDIIDSYKNDKGDYLFYSAIKQ